MKALKTISRRFHLKHLLICILVQMMLFYAPLPALLANPNPAPGTLPSGHSTPYGGVGSFDYSTSGELHINDVANGTVINWQNFDIGAGATTQFHQVNSSAYVLNRVNALDGMATGIQGNLLANGGLIVVNPRGIVIGPDALINAGKFVASGLNLSNQDFRGFVFQDGTSPKLRFTGDENAGTVENSGHITAAESIYLIGKSVTNTSTGILSCPDGIITMVAGEKVYMTHMGSHIVTETSLEFFTPNPGDNTVTNEGTIDADGAEVLLAAGDIFSQAAIDGVGTLAAKANRNIHSNGELNVQGDTLLYADYDKTLPGDFHSTAPITSGGNIEIRGNDVLIDGPVSAGIDLTITGRDCYQIEEWPWGNVTANSTLEAGRDISISVTGEKTESRWVEGTGRCSCGYWESYLAFEPGTITLNGDVTAGQDLSLYNNTYTGPGVSLMAGNDILLANDGLGATELENCEWLQGQDWLALRAGHQIVAPKTTISVLGSSLIMEQGLSLNLDDYLFANQENTDLTLISTGGAVTAVETGTKPQNAADEWKSIGATADNADGGAYAINLSGNQSDITATELKAYNDDIMVNAKAGKVVATENVTADTGSISIIGDSGIDVSKNLTAGSGITLDGVVTAVGTSTQAFEAGAGTLWAKNSITKTGAGDLHLAGDAGVNLDDTVDVDAGSLIIEDDFTAAGDLIASEDITIGPGSTVVSGVFDGSGDQKVDAENGKLSINSSPWPNPWPSLNKTTSGNLKMTAYEEISMKAHVTVDDGALGIEAGGTAGLYGNLKSSGDMTLTSNKNGFSPHYLRMHGNAESTNGSVEMTANGSKIYLYQEAWGKDIKAGQDILLNDHTNVTYPDAALAAGHDLVLAAGKTITASGHLTIEAGHDIGLGVDDMTDPHNGSGGAVTTNGNLTISADPTSDGSNIFAHGKLSSNGNMLIEAGDDIYLKATPDSAYAGGNMTITASAPAGYDGGNLEVAGNLDAAGNVTLSSSNNTTYLGGDVHAGMDILLNNNTNVNGDGDQLLEAGNKLTAKGYVRKCTSGDMYLEGHSEELSVDLQYGGYGPGTSTYLGNLWILGKGDIQISGDVTTFGPGCYLERMQQISDNWLTGGVAIISENGSIYTEGADGALNVSVTGSSDHWAKTGVYGFGLDNGGSNNGPAIRSQELENETKAAIAIVSADELKIGEDAQLTANGTYYDDVDDRAAIGLLDAMEEIPDGKPRNPGSAFDLAVYLASEDSSVDVSSTVTINSTEPGPVITTPVIVASSFPEEYPKYPEYPETQSKGTMVVDAYDTVTFGENFKGSLAQGQVGDRLEVVSRITEWLEDAEGRLPFPEDLVLPDDYEYVMRGAGLENDKITDGRAWVLEDDIEPFAEAAPISTYVGMELGGCPALMSWLAGELNLSTEQVEILFANARGYSYDIQPCNMCSQLQGAARTLLDGKGIYAAALSQVVNQFSSAGAPPSEEQMALIASALQNPEEGTSYAMAGEWLDAMTQYVTMLTQLGLDTEQATAFAAKYLNPIVEGEDTAVAGFVAARLAEIGS